MTGHFPDLTSGGHPLPAHRVRRRFDVSLLAHNEFAALMLMDDRSCKVTVTGTPLEEGVAASRARVLSEPGSRAARSSAAGPPREGPASASPRLVDERLSSEEDRKDVS